MADTAVTKLRRGGLAQQDGIRRQQALNSDVIFFGNKIGVGGRS